MAILKLGGFNMVCPKCNSERVNVQVVTDKVKTNKTGILHSCGRLLLILCTVGLWLLVPKRKENSKMVNSKLAVCQDCGHSWKI